MHLLSVTRTTRNVRAGGVAVGPLMIPALVCDWCGTCAVIPAEQVPAVVRLDGRPHRDLAEPIARALGWSVGPVRTRCPADTRDHADEPALPTLTLTSIE